MEKKIANDLIEAIEKNDEENVHFEIRRLLIGLAWEINGLEELEETGDILYDYLEKKRMEKESMKNELYMV